MFDYNTTRVVTCENCGRSFKDDCGDSFCSASCEREWERKNNEDELEEF